jgi:Rod binding domain-containing protein
MTGSIARSAAVPPPSPLNGDGQNADIRGSATPARRVPVIDREKVPPEIRQAAEGMEAQFLSYMMKVMRESVPKNEMDMENQASEIYRGMMDDAFAEKAAHVGGAGIADTIIAYMQPERYNQDVATKAAQGQVAGQQSQQGHHGRKAYENQSNGR